MTIRNIPQPVSPIPNLQPELQDNRMRSYRACWAILTKLNLAPVSVEDAWAYFASEYDVESRKELSEQQCVKLEAQLRAAQESVLLRLALIAKIQQSVENEPVQPTKLAVPASFKADTQRGRKDIEIAADATDADIQELANERQQTIVRFAGFDGMDKKVTTFNPLAPKAVLLFVEGTDGSKELINTIESPSDDFVVKCEDYADSKQVDLIAHYPDGSWKYMPCMSTQQRQALRENPPTLSGGCTKCGSLTCGGVGSTGKPCTATPETHIEVMDVIVGRNTTEYKVVSDVPKLADLKEWTQHRANTTGNTVIVVGADKVEMLRSVPIAKDRYVNRDVDGEIAQADFYNLGEKRQIDITFSGKSKVYTYDKLGDVDVALCELFAQHNQFDRFYKHITQIRLKYQAYLEGELPACAPMPVEPADDINWAHVSYYANPCA